MRTIIIPLLLMSVLIGNAQEKMKVIYVYDALCGWCYGFSPVIEKLASKYEDQVEVEVISGGMITGPRIGPIGEVAPYIKSAYKDVERTAGVEFGERFLSDILQDGEAVFTSIPPSVALSVFKSMRPEEGLAFAAALQKAIYYDGIEPLDLSAYGRIAVDFGLDAEDFVSKMQRDEYSAAAESDFKRAAELGVQGFPTVLVLQGGRYHLIARGFLPFERLEEQLLQFIGQ